MKLSFRPQIAVVLLLSSSLILLPLSLSSYPRKTSRGSLFLSSCLQFENHGMTFYSIGLDFLLLLSFLLFKILVVFFTVQSSDVRSRMKESRRRKEGKEERRREKIHGQIVLFQDGIHQHYQNKDAVSWFTYSFIHVFSELDFQSFSISYANEMILRKKIKFYHPSFHPLFFLSFSFFPPLSFSPVTNSPSRSISCILSGRGAKEWREREPKITLD